MNGIVELSDNIVPLVDKFLKSDPLINAYAIWDLHHLRYKTKFFVYLDDRNLVGLLLDYLGDNGLHFIWLWGMEGAVEKLLRIPLHDKMFFCAFPEHENVIRRKFPILQNILWISWSYERGKNICNCNIM